MLVIANLLRSFSFAKISGKNEKGLKREFYVSLLFNSKICQENGCLVYYIDHFMQWGTPEDLNDYRYLASKVPLNFPENDTSSVNIIMMAGKGERMKTIAETKKPYLQIDNKPMFNLCTKNIHSSIKTIYAVNGDDEDRQNLIDLNENQIVEVGLTNSPLITLSKTLPLVADLNSEHVLVCPSDASVNVNWVSFSQFSKKLEGNSVVIFSFTEYPTARWKPREYGWLEIGERNNVLDIGLKSGWNSDFSNPIITGYFWFSSIQFLTDELERYMHPTEPKGEEGSLDGFCAYMLEGNSNSNIYHFPVDDFLCLGTPYEFRSYEYWTEVNKIAPLS